MVVFLSLSIRLPPARPHGCHFRTSFSFSVLARLVRHLCCFLVISCCLSSGACWFCFRSEVYSLFFCKPHNSRDKGLLVAMRLGMLHLRASCKQMRPFSLGCIAKDVCSGELAVLHKCDNTPSQLALTSFTRGKLPLALSLRSSHCAIFMSTLKCRRSTFTLFLHSVSSKKKNKKSRCFS